MGGLESRTGEKKGVSMTLREKVGNKPDPDVKPVNWGRVSQWAAVSTRDQNMCESVLVAAEETEAHFISGVKQNISGARTEERKNMNNTETSEICVWIQCESIGINRDAWQQAVGCWYCVTFQRDLVADARVCVYARAPKRVLACI